MTALACPTILSSESRTKAWRGVEGFHELILHNIDEVTLGLLPFLLCLHTSPRKRHPCSSGTPSTFSKDTASVAFEGLSQNSEASLGLHKFQSPHLPLGHCGSQHTRLAAQDQGFVVGLKEAAALGSGVP